MGRAARAYRAGPFLVGEGAGHLRFGKETLPSPRAMRCSVSGKAQIPSAVVAVDRVTREGEEEEHLSGLALPLTLTINLT